MQNYTNKPDNEDQQASAPRQSEQPVSQPTPAPESSNAANQSDLHFMKENPVVFFILEYGALLVANYCGLVLGIVLSLVALISGYRYRQIKKTHGTVMMVLSALMLLFQF